MREQITNLGHEIAQIFLARVFCTKNVCLGGMEGRVGGGILAKRNFLHLGGFCRLGRKHTLGLKNMDCFTFSVFRLKIPVSGKISLFWSFSLKSHHHVFLAFGAHENTKNGDHIQVSRECVCVWRTRSGSQKETFLLRFSGDL